MTLACRIWARLIGAVLGYRFGDAGFVSALFPLVVGFFLPAT